MKQLADLARERAEIAKQEQTQKEIEQRAEDHRRALFMHIAEALVELALVDQLKVADLAPFTLKVKPQGTSHWHKVSLEFSNVRMETSGDVWIDGQDVRIDEKRWTVYHDYTQHAYGLTLDDALAHAYQILEDEQIPMPTEYEELPF